MTINSQYLPELLLASAESRSTAHHRYTKEKKEPPEPDAIRSTQFSICEAKSPEYYYIYSKHS